MKLVIAGGRELEISYDLLEGSADIFKLHDITEVVCGGCPDGVDKVVKNYFEPEVEGIKYKQIDAKWTEEGRPAGPIRNKKIAYYGDALLLIWDGESRGSKNMKEEMLKLNKPVYEVVLRKHNV